MPFQFEPLEIPGVVRIESVVFPDQRGFFMETYKRSDFVAAGITEHFVQDNHSASVYRALRGLHYQLEPGAQGKLVRVVLGEVFDVAVDLRRGSPTLGRWVGGYLSADNRRMHYVPPWCAHGFCVVSEAAEVVYKVTREYAPELESGIIWNDPEVGIDWPIEEPFLSAKDASLPSLRDINSPFVYSEQVR